jgi:hypothetical protein
MVKCIRKDKVALSATLRVSLEELRILANSVNSMADKYTLNLLNLSPDTEERYKLATYNALKEQLRKILDSLT